MTASELADVVEQLGVGIWVFEPSFTQPVYVSRRALDIWGVSPERVRSTPLAFLDNVYPADRARLKAAIDTGAEGHLHVRLEQHDGEIRWVRIQAGRIGDRSGRAGMMVGTVEDVTERRRADLALRASEAHYRRLVEASPYAIYSIDTQGYFTELNPAAERILGRPAAQVLGTHFGGVIVDEEIGPAGVVLGQLLSGEKQRVELDLHVKQPVGPPRCVSLVVAAIVEHGRIIGAQGIGRDVTDERAREEQLRRAERFAALGTLMGGVAHELNNPLQAIAGFAEMLLQDGISPDEQRQALEIICREARRTSRIVQDIKLLSRSADKTEIRKTLVDINDIVQHVLRVRSYALETGNIEVIQDLAEDLPAVLADAQRLEQVLLNLLINSEQALGGVPTPRRITVTSEHESGSVAFAVHDNGPGVPPECMPYLFDPFWTTKPPGEGMGLGLPTVYSVVQEHHGTVTVRSDAETGTVFRVSLPSEDASTAPVQEPAVAGALVAPQEPASPADTLRVLIVDDEESIRLFLNAAARRGGYSADTARDGSEALTLIARAESAGAPYDLILSDLRMPGMNGHSLVSALLERDPGFADRVVLMTGDPGAGVDGCSPPVPVVQKPIPLEDICRLFATRASEARRS